jgi:2-hydroxy-6-oxo-6-(2'-carboxyphenyl)-hexa-2,4-dienoate hydrolase
MALDGEKFIDVDGVRTRYVDRGTGDTIVLFHGGNFGSTGSADATDDWGGTIDDIAKWGRVVAIDKLGQGYTENPKSDDDYTMAAVVKHAYQTLRALSIESAHLVGHSRGGYLTCRLTVDYPEIAKSCVIVSSNTCAPGTGGNEKAFANQPKPSLTAESQRWVLEHYSYSPDCVTDEWVEALAAIAQQQSYAEAVEKMTQEGYLWTKFLPGLLTDKEEMFRILQTRGIQRPVLQIWGYNDPTVSHAQAYDLYRILAEKERRARWQTLNEAGHFCYREQRKRFNEVLQSFITNA